VHTIRDPRRIAIVCARSSRDYGDEEPLTFGLFGDRKTSNNASNISSNKFWKGACKPFDLLEKLCGSTPSERAIEALHRAAPASGSERDAGAASSAWRKNAPIRGLSGQPSEMAFS
jgi:hypothetical protein